MLPQHPQALRGHQAALRCPCPVLTQRRAGCAQVPFLGSVAHQGFVRSAENVVADTLPALRSAAANPELAGYELVVTGHSLGGCTAQTVALQLRDVGALTARVALAFLGRYVAVALVGSAVRGI